MTKQDKVQQHIKDGKTLKEAISLAYTDFHKETPLNYQQGGQKKPIYVESKNDPRYVAYNDSLSVSNYYNNIKKQISRTKQFPDPDTNMKTTFSVTGEYKSMLPKTKIEKLLSHPDSDIRKDFSKYNSGTETSMKPIDVLKYPSDKWYSVQAGILPIYKKPTQPIGIRQNIELKLNSNNSGYILQSDGSKYYDKSIPIGKYVDPLNHKGDGEMKLLDIIKPREKIKSIENSLKPIGIQNNNSQKFETDLNIRQVTPQPKYYDITDKVNQNFGGSETNYKWIPENGVPLKEMSKEVYPDGTPYNERKMTPRFQQGGGVTLTPNELAFLKELRGQN